MNTDCSDWPPNNPECKPMTNSDSAVIDKELATKTLLALRVSSDIESIEHNEEVILYSIYKARAPLVAQLVRSQRGESNIQESMNHYQNIMKIYLA